YGSSADLTADLAAHLQCSGYEAIFLAEGCANSSRAQRSLVDRVSIKAGTDAAFFSEIEILPPLRTMRKSMFGAANAAPGRISDRESLKVPSCPRPCEARSDAEFPRANPRA